MVADRERNRILVEKSSSTAERRANEDGCTTGREQRWEVGRWQVIRRDEAQQRQGRSRRLEDSGGEIDGRRENPGRQGCRNPSCRKGRAKMQGGGEGIVAALRARGGTGE